MNYWGGTCAQKERGDKKYGAMVSFSPRVHSELNGDYGVTGYFVHSAYPRSTISRRILGIIVLSMVLHQVFLSSTVWRLTKDTARRTNGRYDRPNLIQNLPLEYNYSMVINWEIPSDLSVFSKIPYKQCCRWRCHRVLLLG